MINQVLADKETERFYHYYKYTAAVSVIYQIPCLSLLFIVPSVIVYHYS